MPEPTATWNHARGVWETEQLNLLCGHSEPYLETFMSAGSMRNGAVFARPTSAPPTGANASSSSPDFATPTAWLGRRPAHSVGDPTIWSDPQRSNDLSDQVAAMFPTPLGSDREKGGPNQRGGSGDLRLSSVAAALHAGALLPTPTSRDHKDTGDLSAMPINSILPRVVQDLFPTPRAADGAGGVFPLNRTPNMDNLETRVIRSLTGESTPPPSPDGNSEWEGQLPLPPN